MDDTYDDHDLGTNDADANPAAADEREVRRSLQHPLAGQTEDGLPLETVFDILRNERRQRVLGYVLVADEDVVSIGDLAEHVAAIENDVSVTALASQQRKRVYVALYQCHLPKMADAAVVAFDKDRGTIRPGENIDQLSPYLESRRTDSPDETSSTSAPIAVFASSSLLAYVFAAALGPDGVAVGGAAIVVGALVGGLLEYRRR